MHLSCTVTRRSSGCSTNASKFVYVSVEDSAFFSHARPPLRGQSAGLNRKYGQPAARAESLETIHELGHLTQATCFSARATKHHDTLKPNCEPTVDRYLFVKHNHRTTGIRYVDGLSLIYTYLLGQREAGKYSHVSALPQGAPFQVQQHTSSRQDIFSLFLCEEHTEHIFSPTPFQSRLIQARNTNDFS